MGRKDASATKTPVDQYRKQIGRQDYKKNKPVLKATRLKAEAKKTAIGIKVVMMVFISTNQMGRLLKGSVLVDQGRHQSVKKN
ncbi:triple QxxK/R motif-containing protein isoform X2 [Aquarana catesbeiana]|uniref:triple QxxK/R motif-containing protein isoform X2 n=1 Tax=Aquarana catesbeiana TaxID=8400 RepID=UPI003CCA5384